MLFGDPRIGNEHYLQLTADGLAAETANAGVDDIVQRNTHCGRLCTVRTAVVSNLMNHNAKFGIGRNLKRRAAGNADPFGRLR